MLATPPAGRDPGDAPVFILGVHKSGTSLLRNLLDGHPSLSTVPIELHFPYVQGLPVAYPRRRTVLAGASDTGARIGRLLQVVRLYNEGANREADAFLPGRFDVAAMTGALEAHLGAQAAATDLLAYADAIALSLGADARRAGQALVEKSVDNIEHAWWLKRQFPRARFLFILRDPHSNLVSFRKFVAPRTRFPSLIPLLRTIEMGFHYATLYQQSLPDLHLLRYEDLLSDPRGAMQRVADFLQIEWNEGLLQPTSMGRPWEGNSTTGVAMASVSAAQMNRWMGEVQPIECDLIARSSLALLMPRFGYSPMPTRGWWRRAPGEALKVYLRNRLFRYFAETG